MVQSATNLSEIKKDENIEWNYKIRSLPVSKHNKKDHSLQGLVKLKIQVTPTNTINLMEKIEGSQLLNFKNYHVSCMIRNRPNRNYVQFYGLEQKFEQCHSMHWPNMV